MLTDKFNWAEVGDALVAAEQAKNHYRNMQRLESVVSVVQQAKLMIDAAQRDKLVVDDKIVQAQATLKAVEARVAEATESGNAELARLTKARDELREELSAQHREFTNKASTAQSELKQLAHEAQAARDRLAAEFEEHRQALQRAHEATATKLKNEMDRMLDEHTRLSGQLAKIRGDAAAIAGR